MGLLDVDQLKSVQLQDEIGVHLQEVTTATSRGDSPQFVGSSRPQRGQVENDEIPSQALPDKAYKRGSRDRSENAHLAV